MTHRERVLNALSFKPVDRVPMDLSGMMSTGISCFAYPGLVKALGLPPRPPRVCDTGQMLALPDLDVLDALGIDIVVILGEMTNAFEQPELWHPYDFGGRLPALVRHPENFHTLPDGTILQGNSKMPPNSFVFTSDHAGQPLDLSAEPPKPDLKALKKRLESERLTDAAIKTARELARKVRESTDRAVFYNGPGADIGIGNFGGLGVFPLLCLLEPDFVAELHDLVTRYAAEKIGALLAEIGPYIDIYMISSDDWGVQDHTIASPSVFQELFLPYYRRITDTVHKIAPHVKTFLHSCGAVYDIIDHVIDAGFDILNPVQWPAGGHSYQEWKDRARGRLVLWGGGINSQETLPLGSLDAISREVKEIVSYMAQDSGYVFCNIHNILAEIAPEKIITLYRTACSVPLR